MTGYETVLVRTARQAKIVGGSLAEKGEFPHQVLMSYHDEFFCGGSILSTLLILTAAHCVKYKRPNRLQITAGAYDRSFNGTDSYRGGSGTEQVRTARYIYMHENYVWETDINDIAIIVLSAPLQYTDHVKNISLPRENEEFEGYATVTGWGRTQEKGDVSNILRKVKLPLVNIENCRRMYRKVRMKVTDNMMCAGYTGQDACQGDSGGPAVCKRSGLSGSNSLAICGVVSHGYGCGRSGYPGIYTKVSNYIDWIEETRKKITARGKCQTDHFHCSSGCLPRTFLCDLETDCKEDGVDEQSCIYMTSCRRNQFRCNNGRCIKREYTCDDMDDCGDRSDEDKCPTESKTCVGGEHQCGTGGRCIPNDWKCDNQQDCDDNSDEEGCGGSVNDNEVDTSSSSILGGGWRRGNKTTTTTTTTPAPCSPDQFFCSRDYRCIPLRWRCDGDRDCRSGIDEIGCSNDNDFGSNVTTSTTSTAITSTSVVTTGRPRPTTTLVTTTSTRRSTTTTTTTEATIDVVSTSSFSPTTSTNTSEKIGNNTGVCSRSQFQCDNGQCISNVFQCDFDDDCSDGSDERGCELTELKPRCSAYFWQCSNGECIYHRFLCDGDFDCADKSDELSCDQNNSSEDNGIVSNRLRRRRQRGKFSRQG